MFVRCIDFTEDETLVQAFAQVVTEVPPSDDLFRYIAIEGGRYTFGQLSAKERDDGTLTVIFAHSLLGNYLDPQELEAAVGAVLWTANELDDEIRSRFGGKRFHED